MANGNFISNIARGALKYYYYAVENSLVVTAGQFTSTANAAFLLVLLELAGLEADDTLNNYDDLAALLAAANNEQTNQARKALTETDLAAVPAPDDTNNRLDLDFPDVTYALLGGNTIGKLLLCFDPDTTAGTDSSIIPLTAYDIDVITDGNDVVVQPDAAGFWRSN